MNQIIVRFLFIDFIYLAYVTSLCILEVTFHSLDTFQMYPCNHNETIQYSSSCALLVPYLSEHNGYVSNGCSFDYILKATVVLHTLL